MSQPTASKPTGAYLAALSLAALGVVYGDIGTSPLYALKEVFSEHYGLALTPNNVLGILSLIFWALVLVISVKYLTFVMRADLRGEGGIMVLTALVTPSRAHAPGAPRRPAGTDAAPELAPGETREDAVERVGRRRTILITLGLFGAALLYGDGMITPAISVLSAIEGLEVALPFFADPGNAFLVPWITIAILIALFSVQSRGTAGLGKIFGPLTLTWFLTLAGLGAYQIVLHPDVLAAINPLYGVRFFAGNGATGFLVLGSVFLVVTGGEALYADMGHFGVRPIRLAWFTVVLPALVLNYFGQGALLIANPAARESPFFEMVPGPEGVVFAVVVLATLATCIASQAIISGTFSLTRQAVQLGYLPRLDIRQTSSREIGQIYIPAVNWVLLVACIGLVLGFRTSTNLAAAYGVGVTTDMVFTSILFAVVARTIWKWSLLAVVALVGLFLVLDLGFWGANLVKIPAGGWFPLAVAALVFVLMTTWKRGRAVLAERLEIGMFPLATFLADEGVGRLARVPGTAVFMGGNPDAVPVSLLHTVKHIKCLHETVVILTVRTEEVPRVEEAHRIRVEPLAHGFYRAIVTYGFTDTPDIPAALALANTPGLNVAPMHTTFFLGRERVISTRTTSDMARWRERLFGVMSNNARSATAFFGIPANRVVEMGAQVEI
ncbi:MAG TPA: potassium uptake protein [Rubricoccaceae bacterium]|jgi:KUP system potassium uptake protein